MKKQLLSIFTLTLGAFAFGQIGLNTATPTATLDVNAKNATGTTTNVDGLLIPRIDRLRAFSMTSIPTSTLIYVNSIANGTLAGNAINIDAVGYYFYNGSVWAKLDSGINLYNTDGTLTDNRIVNQGNRTLAFTGTVANAFSVDGTTFSVNAANNRVGIGTITPTAPLEVNVPNVVTGVQVIQPTKSSMTPGIRIAGTGDAPAVGQVSTIGFNPNLANGVSPIAIGASYLDAADTEADADFIVATSQGGNGIIKFTVKNNGRVGVLTTTPQRTMHVNGSLQITNELNLGGNATTAGSAGTTGQVLVSNGAGNAPSWQVAPSGTEVDGVIGNEVLNATAGGALTRSGAGTTANPYTLGISDGDITTAKIADNNVTYAKINTPVTNVTGNYTLLESDKGGFVYVTSAAAANINVPDTLSSGFHCVVIQQGAGQVTVTGNNLTTARGLKTRTQYSAIGVIKRGPGITTVTGDGIN